MEYVTATYRLRCAAAEAPRIARQIALEQTVEVPEELLDAVQLREEFIGRVRTIQPLAAETQLAVIDYPAAVAGTHVGQMWNLLFGNISLKRGIRLVQVELPPSLRGRLRGPRWGVAGLREQLGVFGRPLLATALKPRGSTPEQLAELAAAFAAGGGDLVKDDHNLVDPTFEAFQQRITLCQDAVRRVAERTGRRTVYLPNLSPPAHELERYAEFLTRRGIAGALVAPLLLGLDTVRQLTSQFPLFWMAHPTLTGCFFHDPDHGVDPGVLLGQWFRLIGCDATIFPNLGGRFSFTHDECRGIAAQARTPLGEIRPCWPAPAGGMSYDRLAEMAEAYGPDAIFLIGGALLADSDNLERSTARFLDRICASFPEQSRTAPAPNAELFSACELPAPHACERLLEHLAFQAGYRWDGRAPTAYKMQSALPFRDVARTELIGTHGERTAFDVRYFEIAPGGHSSLEKHAHTHVVIGVRGHGSLQSGDDTIAVKPFDVAYVPPLRVHQLRNDGPEPFGFFCIVDHDRDRPQPP